MSAVPRQLSLWRPRQGLVIRHPVSRLLLSRLGTFVFVLIGGATVIFIAIRLIPGNPAEIMLGPERTAAEVAALTHQWGLDRPIPQQFGLFLLHAAQGDFGRSITSGLPVTQELLGRLPVTGTLALLAMALACGLGVPMGILAATHRGRFLDRATSLVSLIGVAFPSFWIGLLLIGVFAVSLRWLPAVGVSSPTAFILPAVTLMFEPLALIARQTRSALLEVLGQEYVTTARSRGLNEWRVIFGHALRNAAVPIVTVGGLAFGRLLGGSIIVESLFGLPGIGSLTVNAIGQRDYPILQGIAFLFVVIFAATNLAVDVSVGVLDRRVRLT